MDNTQKKSPALEDIRQRLTYLEQELAVVGYPPAPNSKFAAIGEGQREPSEIEELSRERDRRYEAASSEYNRLKSAESSELARFQAEANRQRLDELIAADVGVIQATARHAQAIDAIRELTDELRKVDLEIEGRRGAAGASLNEVSLARLFGLAKGKAGAVGDLHAYELARDEIQQRLVTAEAQASEAAAELRSAQRAVVHRHIDMLIESTRDGLLALNDALRDIGFWERQVHTLGGRRHPFLSRRVRDEIEGVCDRINAEIRDVAALSETY